MSAGFTGRSLAQDQIEITALDASDVAAMIALERDSAEYPWTEAQYLSCTGPEYRFLGAWYGGELVGFLIDWRMLGEGHLMNICIHRQFQRHGGGRCLLRYWLATMQREGVATLTLEVRESNRAARELYASEGFEHRGTRPGYYRTATGTEAAHVMGLSLAVVRASNH
ncbi:ribosomal protein S18-alanine N-acetyltransferase [Halomonadaceae bacterium KBTZ08]